MKKPIRFLYKTYHFFFDTKNPSCRYLPTCSEYSLVAFEKYGILKGAFLSVKRILSCHPLSKKPVYDPVPNSYKFGLKIRINSH